MTPPALGAPHETVLVSLASEPEGAKGNDWSFSPSISADGRFVAFASWATNLDPYPDDSESPDIFVRDVREQTTTLVSRASGADGAKGNGYSAAPSISADGRFVAFSSNAANLHPADTDTTSNVFVRDLHEQITTLVSRGLGSDDESGDRSSHSPSISADGRFIAFASESTTEMFVSDIFVRDVKDNTTTMVSRATGADGSSSDGYSTAPSISADGRFVAFSSEATNLHPAATDDTRQVFSRDLQEHTTTLVSRASGAGGARGNDWSFDPSISADGRFVEFESYAANLHPDDGEDPDIFVRDLEEYTTTLVSRATGADGEPANGGHGSISADGRFVAFASWATNLDPHPDDGYNTHVFVRDLEDNTTTLASRASGRCGAPMAADLSSISADGRFIAFGYSIPEPSLDRRQIFRRELSLGRESLAQLNRPAELEINRARVRAGRLVVSGSLNPAAAGQRVAMTFRAAGRLLRVRPLVRESGWFRAAQQLRDTQRRARSGRLVVRYAGNETLRAASERLRAARKPVRLRIDRAEAQRDRLMLAGRVVPRARGRVRIGIEFIRPDCSPAQVTGRAKVNDRGGFRLRRDLPLAARGLKLRVSVTHPGRGRLHGQRVGQDVTG